MNGSVPFELVQHVTVFVIALAAAAVVLRKVLGVFERRPAGSAAGATHGASPACGHCAAGHAAMKKVERDGHSI